MNLLIVLSTFLIVFFSLQSLGIQGVKKEIIKELNICKRNDPEISKCYCGNFNNIIPLLKNGIPEMSIVPIDPIVVQEINMTLPETRNVRLSAVLSNVTVEGLSKGKVDVCEAVMTNDGIQLHFQIYFPEVILKSQYKAGGKVLLVTINADSDFNGEFHGMLVNTVWNSTRYMNNNKDHLKFTNKILDMQINKIKINFNDILGPNSTDISDSINETINSNIEFLYGEIKPVILATISRIALSLTNELYTTFPFDMLYPKE